MKIMTFIPQKAKILASPRVHLLCCSHQRAALAGLQKFGQLACSQAPIYCVDEGVSAGHSSLTDHSHAMLPSDKDVALAMQTS